MRGLNIHGNGLQPWGNRAKLLPGDLAVPRNEFAILDRGQLLFTNPENGSPRAPKVQAIVLSVRSLEATGDVEPAFSLRWVLSVGNGGGNERFVFDAGGTQLIALPTEQVRISIMTETLGRFSGISYSGPTDPIDVSAMVTDGPIEGSGCTYTEFFTVANGSSIVVPAPLGANSFRIASDTGSASDAYDALTTYATLAPSDEVIDSFTGAFLAPIRYAPMPFNPQAVTLQIVNGAAAPAFGYIEWGLGF